MQVIDNIKTLCDRRDYKIKDTIIKSINEQKNYKSLIYQGNQTQNFNDRLVDDDLNILCECFQEFANQIENIDLSYNKINDTECLAQLIPMCENLQSINLQGNDITNVNSLCVALKGLTNLHYINIAYNQIKNEGAMAFADLLFSNTNLIELNLAENDINHDGIIALTSVLNWNNSYLKVLNLDSPVYSSICQETAIHFGKMLQNNRGIEKLSLKKHQFTCDAIYTITEHLLENPKLRVLDLTANKISFKGCEALAKYLMNENCQLESLILSSNRTGHFGAKMIARAINQNRTLRHLDMTRNFIDDNGLRMLAVSLQNNQQLVSIKLYDNNFEQESLKCWHALLQKQFILYLYRKKNHTFYLDFKVYMVGSQFQMAYIDTVIPFDVKVSQKYFQ